jgi:hypothetical protein
MSTMAGAAQLSLIPFADWVRNLEVRSARATAEDIEKIVSQCMWFQRLRLIFHSLV